MIDLVLMAELVVAVLIVATLDTTPPPPAKKTLPPSLQQDSPPINVITPTWSPETDLHAMRVLRLANQHRLDRPDA
jgi:hypothetical protein